jgi:hypothetical protein
MCVSCVCVCVRVVYDVRASVCGRRPRLGGYDV